jgi:hypothetical protein
MCEGDVNVASGTVTTMGGAGVAAGTATINCIPGWLECVQIDFGATAPGTTDTALTQADSPTALLTVTSSATDATFYPRATCVDTAGAAITNSYTKLYCHGPVLVTVAQCDALAPAMTVYITTSG